MASTMKSYFARLATVASAAMIATTGVADAFLAPCGDCACPNFHNNGAIRLHRPRAHMNGSGNKHAQWTFNGGAVPWAQNVSPMNAWEEAGVNNMNQKNLSFFVLNQPMPEDVQFLAFFVAGQQLSPGTALTVTGQDSDWKENVNLQFGSDNWTEWDIGIDKRGAAWNFVHSDASLPNWSYGLDRRVVDISKTLVIGMTDASFTYPPTNTFNQNAKMLNGWTNWLDKRVANWNQIKGFIGYGMSRGGCFVALFADHLVKNKPALTSATRPGGPVKIVLETLDPVCHTSEFPYDVTTTPPLEYGRFLASSQVARSPHNAVTGEYRCVQAKLNNLFPGVPKSNIRWKSSIGGQGVALFGRAFCDTTTVPASLPGGQWGQLAPTNAFMSVGFEFLQRKIIGSVVRSGANPGTCTDCWYEQTFFHKKHCEIARLWGFTDENCAASPAGDNCVATSDNLNKLHGDHLIAAANEFKWHPAQCVTSTVTACSPAPSSGLACGGGTRTRKCYNSYGTLVSTTIESCPLVISTAAHLNSVCFFAPWQSPTPASPYNCQPSEKFPASQTQTRIGNGVSHLGTSTMTFPSFANGLYVQLPTTGTISALSTTAAAVPAQCLPAGVAALSAFKVTGSGTKFKSVSQVKVGQYIASAGTVIGAVVAVCSDVELYVKIAPTNAVTLPTAFKVLDEYLYSADAKTVHNKQVPFCTWRSTSPTCDSASASCAACFKCDAVPAPGSEVFGYAIDLPSWQNVLDSAHNNATNWLFDWKKFDGTTVPHNYAALNPASFTHIVGSTVKSVPKGNSLQPAYATLGSSTDAELQYSSTDAELQYYASTDSSSGQGTAPGGIEVRGFNPNCYSVTHPTQAPKSTDATHSYQGFLYRCGTPASPTFSNSAFLSTCFPTTSNA